MSAPPVPPPAVLDLFAVPDDVEALPGGQGGSVRAGDLVLSPGREAATAAWLSPLLARLAVGLDETPGRRWLRIAMPVPARDGSWVIDGWAASRWEPGTTTCRNLDVTLAAARLLHARLASLVPTRPAGLDASDQAADRYVAADRAAFGEGGLPDHPIVRRAAAALDGPPADLGPSQLVHGDLAGNVLMDPAGSPVVIDVAPYWRPVRWAEAVCVLDSVLWWGAPPAVLQGWRTGADRQAMLRAVVFRVLSDPPPADARYSDVLDLIGAAPG